jgi:hypothetical protein
MEKIWPMRIEHLTGGWNGVLSDPDRLVLLPALIGSTEQCCGSKSFLAEFICAICDGNLPYSCQGGSAPGLRACEQPGGDVSHLGTSSFSFLHITNE